MKDIVIYGAGGLGKEVACLINIINRHTFTWNLLGFLDDNKAIGLETGYGKVLGGIKELIEWNRPLSVVVAISSPQTLFSVINKITSPFIDFPNIISPDLFFMDPENCSLGRGNIIFPRCMISCNVNVNDFNFFNSDVAIGHDVEIGSYNSFMPSVRISGEVSIGNKNFFGVSSIVLQQLRIGNETIIGGNSMVIRKTKDGMTYLGSPASIIKY